MFDKIIIWGHKLHTHTHSYIHYGFYKAFKRDWWVNNGGYQGFHTNGDVSAGLTGYGGTAFEYTNSGPYVWEKFEFSFLVGDDWHLSGPVKGCRGLDSSDYAYCTSTYNGSSISGDDVEGCEADPLCDYYSKNNPYGRIYMYPHQVSSSGCSQVIPGSCNEQDTGRIWFDSIELKITNSTSLSAGPYSYNLTSPPHHGTISYINPAGGSETIIDEYPFLSDNNCFKYIPDVNYPSGNDVQEWGYTSMWPLITFTGGRDSGLDYKVIDSGTSEAAGLESNIATVTFDVNPIEDELIAYNEPGNQYPNQSDLQIIEDTEFIGEVRCSNPDQNAIITIDYIGTPDTSVAPNSSNNLDYTAGTLEPLPTTYDGVQYAYKQFRYTPNPDIFTNEGLGGAYPGYIQIGYTCTNPLNGAIASGEWKLTIEQLDNDDPPTDYPKTVNVNEDTKAYFHLNSTNVEGALQIYTIWPESSCIRFSSFCYTTVHYWAFTVSIFFKINTHSYLNSF